MQQLRQQDVRFRNEIAVGVGGKEVLLGNGTTLFTDDVGTTHAELKPAGLDVDAEVSLMGDPVPAMFSARGPSGH